jgi:hypothetical protein
MLGGAWAGAASVDQRAREEKAALEQQKKSAWKQYQYGQQYSDEMFALQKGEALGQLAVQRRNLGTQMGMSVDSYNTSLLAQAFGIQDARIQAGSAIGGSLAAEGMGGTRGNAANEMARSYASQGLERNVDVQDRQNRDYLNQMVSGANMAAGAIGREEASWMPGGYRARAKDAQDSYNRNLAQLGQDNFDWQIDQASPTDLDYFTGIMGGMSSGFSLGSSVNNMLPWFGIGA